MSKQTALQFLQKAVVDKTLQEKMRAASMDAVLEVAKKAGYEFNASDYKAAVLAFQELSSDELAEDVLDMIAGGTGFSGVRTDDSSSISTDAEG
ncbi:MAG: Nif11-like leader peptide family natural product precursor [Chloroflexi bacterium]|nr:Nif11-like leader peptide family natural product precursor [Chloroflexota bacterium]